MTLLESLREHLIRDVFAPAIAHKPASIATVEHFGGDMRFADGDLLFTLPQLFAFVLADFERNHAALCRTHRIKPVRLRTANAARMFTVRPEVPPQCTQPRNMQAALVPSWSNTVFSTSSFFTTPLSTTIE